MRRGFFLLAGIAAAIAGSLIYLNNRDVMVMGGHHNQYTAEILVDHLPLSQVASVQWWLKNQNEIRLKYNIVSEEEGGPALISIFAFGDGYKELGKEDRLCFDDMQPPKNCIDKKRLMAVYFTRDGITQFRFDYSTYQLTDDGRIIKVK
ncbi:MAG: DUF943 family protein [Pantoea sp.]|uniref:DUF943 family protein n=1 Tax=Pantoea sp. TaxID=69393 RepID=UPI00238EAB0C|nr:DUF943 family protein [Pantoea sp.]MDE1188664.1 DUF943 family protein [Pantoea sp.]